MPSTMMSVARGGGAWFWPSLWAKAVLDVRSAAARVLVESRNLDMTIPVLVESRRLEDGQQERACADRSTPDGLSASASADGYSSHPARITAMNIPIRDRKSTRLNSSH